MERFGLMFCLSCLVAACTVECPDKDCPACQTAPGMQPGDPCDYQYAACQTDNSLLYCDTSGVLVEKDCNAMCKAEFGDGSQGECNQIVEWCECPEGWPD